MWIRIVVASLCIYRLSLAIYRTEDIDMCSVDLRGYRFCESENALCMNDPNSTLGFKCYCAAGQVRKDGGCTDISEENDASEVEASTNLSNDLTAKSTSSSFSSSVLSGSSVQNTTKILNVSVSDTSYFFISSTTESSNVLSSLSPPALSSFEYDQSTNFKTTSDIPDTDGCSGNWCSENAVCLKLSRGYRCKCKTGFVPHKELTGNSRRCFENCTSIGCADTCKQIKCLLKEKEEDPINITIVHRKYGCSGWHHEPIIVCSVLFLLLAVFVGSTAYMLLRYRKLKRNQQLEANKIVYKKMDKNSSQYSDSKDDLVFKGIDYI